MPCTQKWAIVVACHHIMNMHDGNKQLPFPSCLPAFYALAIPMSCYISNVFYYLYSEALHFKLKHSLCEHEKPGYQQYTLGYMTVDGFSMVQLLHVHLSSNHA